MIKRAEVKFRYYKVFKPFGVLSQFTAEGDHPTLASLGKFPRDVYPVGRLDHDTEGLLLLTNDTRVNHLLLDPKFQHKKTYWAQIEGEMNQDGIQQLQKGILINLKGNLHRTKPALVKRISSPKIPERNPSVNYIKHPKTSWIELTITEGKNRQVRKMTAKVGHPTLRLIRYAIEELSLERMKSGEVIELKEEEFYPLLKLQSFPERSRRSLNPGASFSRPERRGNATPDSQKPKMDFQSDSPALRKPMRDKRTRRF